jgi:NitT/TauT family transport system substrate-binding protein
MRRPSVSYTRPGAMAIVAAGLLASLSCAAPAPGQKVTIRAGHFPNITHAQGVLGQATGRFQQAMGDKATIDWKVFNAGPSAIEAMFAGELDLTYIGPNPAINGYVKSNGTALRIVCGACSGGAALVVRSDVPIAEPRDFEGRSLATPQLGNTQDVAARAWLLKNGMDWLERGGKVRVQPLANPDQLTLFQKKEMDAAWTVEPWVSRLVQEGGGKVFLEEGDLWPARRYVTTHLIVAKKFLDQHPDLVRAWIEEHVRITDWINANREEAMRQLNAEIKQETGKALPVAILVSAFSRLELTDDPVSDSLMKSAEDAFALGFLGKDRPHLSGIYDLSILNDVRKTLGRPPLR